MKFNEDPVRRRSSGLLFGLTVLGILAAFVSSPRVARAEDGSAGAQPPPAARTALPHPAALPAAPAENGALATLPARMPAADPAPSKPKVYTNADLEALGSLPIQKRPIAESPGWDFVWTVLDRERAEENRRKDREIALQALAAREAEAQAQLSAVSYPGYLPGVIVGTRFCRGRCGPRLDIPSNTFESLDMRGIRTATDLFHESVSNTQILRRHLP